MTEKLNLFIGGSSVKTLQKMDRSSKPCHTEVLCEAPCTTDEEIESAIGSAKEAFFLERNSSS